MNAEQLREAQAPLKRLYREDPDAARITLRAEGRLGQEISCHVDAWRGTVEAGLHPATGGTDELACSGDMLLQALVACAGVTLRAVATALEIPVQAARLQAEGDLDFRGTLGVSKDVPVGFSDIRLSIELETAAGEEAIDRLIQLSERYCVVYQTLRSRVRVEVSHRIVPGSAG